MKANSLIRIEGLFSIIGAIGILVWWFTMPLLIPVEEADENFQNLVLNNNWLAVNMIGLVSTLFLTIGFPGFFLKNYEKYNKLGFISLIITVTGLILYTCIQYYETILWPAAAEINPELLHIDGALVSGDTRVMMGLIISGAFLGIGYILFGISALQAKTFPKLPIWLVIIGAPLFGLGVAFHIRTIGVILFCIGTGWLAGKLRKRTS